MNNFNLNTPSCNPCCTAYTISLIACQLCECMSDDEAALLAADLVLLGDNIVAIVARRALCCKKDEPEKPVETNIELTAEG